MSERKRIFADVMTALGLGSRPKSLIGGDLMDGQGEVISLVDPFTEEALSDYPDAGADLARKACQVSADAQRNWIKDYSAAARGQVLQNISRAVIDRAEPLARLEALIAGKPIRDCRVEVAKVAEMFAYYGGWADKLHGEVIPVPSGHLNYTLARTVGRRLSDHNLGTPPSSRPAGRLRPPSPRATAWSSSRASSPR